MSHARGLALLLCALSWPSGLTTELLPLCTPDRWPIRYYPLSLKRFPDGSEERSDVYGYLYLLMLTHQLTGNVTLLGEAIAVHNTPGALHRGEFFNMFER